MLLYKGSFLLTGVQCGKPTHFTIDTKGAGKAKPDVKFKPARGSYRAPADEAKIVDNKVRIRIRGIGCTARISFSAL